MLSCFRDSHSFTPRLTRREFACAAAGVGLASLLPRFAIAANDDFDFNAPLIRPPDDSARGPAFRDALARWRTETRKNLNYDGSLYGRTEFAWTQSCFIWWTSSSTELNFWSGRMRSMNSTRRVRP